jgi:hypothetical protein
VEPTAPTRAEKFNPAYRIFKLLTDAKDQPANIPTIAAWSNTLAVTGMDPLDERFHTVE